jgi:hypothetical protein
MKHLEEFPEYYYENKKPIPKAYKLHDSTYITF